MGSWLEALRQDKHEIFRAARDAHTAADLLLALELEPSIEKALASVNSHQAGAQIEEPSLTTSGQPPQLTLPLQIRSPSAEIAL
jgi:hypothetical protein